MGDIFENVLEEVSKKTPSIGKEFDILIKNPKLTKEESEKYLDETIKRDVKLLEKFRTKLKEDLLLQAETIKMANKIVNEGEIGKVVNVEDNIIHVCLNQNIQAFDTNWKQVAKPGEDILMIVENEEKVNLDDLAIIENETLCIKRNKAKLQCNIILCNV